MTAPLQTRTTIGQLVYRSQPAVDFVRMAADLDAALVGCDSGRLEVVEESGDLALIDVGASRVGVALMQGLDRKGAAAVVVTVGYGPAVQGDASLARRQSVLARLIAERIASRYAPQEALWTATDEVATPELFERLRHDLQERRRAQAEALEERARARRALPSRMVEPGDVTRMFARVESTLAARRMGWPELQPAPAAASPQGTAAAAPGHRLERPSAPMRLAAHLIDATLMVVALPVGAAMMVYGLARGADINTSSRALALSGAGIGALQATGGVAGLQEMLLRMV